MNMNTFDSHRVDNVMQMWRGGALDFERTPGNKNITGLLCQRIDTCEKYIVRQDRAINELEADLDRLMDVGRTQSKILKGPLIPLLKLWWLSRAA
jgi:hypothetical protein